MKLTRELEGMSEPLTCEDCGRLYGTEDGFCDFVVPDDAWKQISTNGDEGGLLCACCMMSRMFRLGMSEVPGAFTSGPCRNPLWKKPMSRAYDEKAERVEEIK